MIYTWFPLAVLLLLLLLIARYYEKLSGKRTYFRWYVVPLVLFGVAMARYASAGLLAGDRLGDILLALAGSVLLVLSVSLYRLMVAGRQP